MNIEMSMGIYHVPTVKRLLELGENRPEMLFFCDCEVTNEITETCLNPWYPCWFEKDGIVYTSAGQYMMAEKAKLFGDEETRTEILNTTDPMECRTLGRKVKNFDKAAWDKEKDSIAHRANDGKFIDNASLRTFLLSTNDKILVNVDPDDCTWGIGLEKDNPDALDPAKWKGENLWGISLMSARNFIAFMDYFGEFDEDEDDEGEGENT